MTATMHCRECTKPFQATKRFRYSEVTYVRRRFCSKPCRKAFNNRCAVRGAEMYDLFRAARRERQTAKEMNIWTALCRLEEKWQEEDDRERPDRRSYVPPREALMKLVDAGRIGRHLTPNEMKEVVERSRAVNAAKDRARKEERENANA